MPRKFGDQSKQIAYNLYSYYKKRKMDKNAYEFKEDINIIDWISEATRMPKSSINRIIKEGNAMKVETGVVDFRPKEKKKHTRKKRIQIDEFTEGVVRRKLIQLASIRKLKALLREENILKCSLEYLRQLVHKLGFKSTEIDSSGAVSLQERPDIVLERMNYVQAVKNFRAQDRPIFYLNEIKRWARDKHAAAKLKEMPSLVIVHTSGTAGFLDEAQLMLKMKPNSDDDECFEHFENYDWIKDAVLQNLPSNSVVVMNIPYSETPESMLPHEKPTAESSLSSIKSWLQQHHFPFNETAPESEILELLNNIEAKLEYSFTKIIKESGHDVLHLPRNHSDLNPVAVMWHDVNEDASEFSAKELFTRYPSKKWRACLEHVQENEDEYYTHGINVVKRVCSVKTDKKEFKPPKSKKRKVKK